MTTELPIVYARAKVIATTPGYKFGVQLSVKELLTQAGVEKKCPGLVSEVARAVTRAPIFDMRSPSEYEKGHIPGSHSLPLFTDKQRETVGITYKCNGKEAAIRSGLKFVDVSYVDLVAIVEKVAGPPPADVFVYCWRGGMRSGSASTLLKELGYTTHCLKGGYKATGTGKTDMLMELRAKHGAQVLDLEGEANHRGSNFGHLHT
eukprot:gene24046-9657_t